MRLTVSPLVDAAAMPDARVGADEQRSPRDRGATGESKAAMTDPDVERTGNR